VDTRVILATNEDLAKAVERGVFRQDLYYRVNVVNIVLPPLRDRIGDVPLLVDHFLREVAEACGREVIGFDQAAMAVLQSYHWPGNIRQLENVVERAVLLSRDAHLTIEDLPPELSGQAASRWQDSGAAGVESFPAIGSLSRGEGGVTLREALEGPERQIILHALPTPWISTAPRCTRR
jgi:DNA-binding NtrC family response regulator